MPDDIIEYSHLLVSLGIENEIIQHPEYKAIKDVLSYLNATFSDCSPTLIMKADGTFIAVVSRGDNKVDFKKIKKNFSIKNLRMATPEEFVSLTGVPLGAARVYTPAVSKTIIDKRVMENEYVFGGSGSFSYTIKYKSTDLSHIPHAVQSDIINISI